MGGWICYHDKSKLHASILTKKTGFVGKGNDHLQLINFGRLGTGVCGGAKILGSTASQQQPARSVCVSSEHFFIHYKIWSSASTRKSTGCERFEAASDWCTSSSGTERY